MRSKKKKQITIYLLGVLTILIMIFSIIAIPCINNDKYEQKILKSIYDNTNIKNINYVNKSNNYYIIKNDTKAIVLDLNYDIIKELPLINLYQSNKPLSYRKGNLYYEEKERTKNSLIYKYYNAENYEYAFEITVGGI